MNTKLTLQVYSGYSLLIGFSFLGMAGTVIEGMGITPTPELIATQQIWGAYIVGIGVLVWFLSGLEDKAFFKGLVSLTGLVVIWSLYHIIAKDLGAPPIYINTVVNAAVCAFWYPKMR